MFLLDGFKELEEEDWSIGMFSLTTFPLILNKKP